VYVIESGIPIPTSRGINPSPTGPRTEWTRALSALEVGQSVFTGDRKEYKAAEQFAIRSRPKQFALRKIAGQGWRVWRTA
jgi:hypothetical protein